MQCFLSYTVIIFLKYYSCQFVDGPKETRSVTAFPFYTQLRCPILGQPGKASRCGGSLVRPQWVLTAASCFPKNTDEKKWLIHQPIAMIFMGSARIFDFHYGFTNFIKSILQHPNYSIKGGKFYNNIALVNVDKPYEMSAVIQTIPLCQLCWCGDGVLIGMGLSHFNQSDSFTLQIQYTYLKLQTDSTSSTTFYTEEEVGGLYDGSIGSPLICSNNLSAPVLIGILSSSVTIKQGIRNTFERVGLFSEFISERADYVDDGRRKRDRNGTHGLATPWYTIVMFFYLSCNLIK